MGLFSSKKKVYVSSSLYNLAGDQEERVKFLPTTVVGQVLSGRQDTTLGQAINAAYLSGPGIKLRGFARWARTQGYNTLVGLRADRIDAPGSVDTAVIVSQIPHAVDEEVSIQTAEVSGADYGFWADQYMLTNHPAEVDMDYEIDFDEVANIIYIRWPDASFYSFTPVGYNNEGEYLYVSYNLSSGGDAGPVIPGTVEYVDEEGDFPSIDTWDFEGDNSYPQSDVLTTTVLTEVTYSDSTPPTTDTVETDDPVSYTNWDKTFSKLTYNGQSGVPGAGDETTSTRNTYYQYKTGYIFTLVPVVEETTEEISPGVTKTTKVTTTTQEVAFEYAYRIDSQEIVNRKWTPLKMMIYRKGTGNPTLDALFAASINEGNFFPYIPIRAYNSFISPTNRPDVYAGNVKACKRALGTSYDKLVQQVADNPSLGDIDFVYAVFGVSLNVKENSCKKYLYKFFQTILSQGTGGTGAYAAWRVQWNTANAAKLAWNSWKDAQSDPASPLYGTPAPPLLPYPKIPFKRIKIESFNLNYCFFVNWTAIAETTGTGLGKPGAKAGDVWITVGATENYDELLYSSGQTATVTNSVDFISIHWQDGPNTHRTMGIWGLWHDNKIWKGKSVIVSAKDALEDEEESGFVIPLHEGIYRNMSLKDATQMATACCFMTFNCYKVVKQKWYASSWFKVVLIVAAIAITIVTLGSGGPASAGILGTYASVGAALGFAGTVALIVGGIANALAAMILSQILMSASTALLGDRLGPIVGAIASIIALNMGTSLATGQTATANLSSLANADSIMKLSVAAGDGYAGYLKADAQDTIKAAQQLLDDYTKQSNEISQAYGENLGFGSVLIDPMTLTDSFRPPEPFIPETVNSFLGRTLMTGSDVADLSLNMVYNFTTITLSTDLAQ